MAFKREIAFVKVGLHTIDISFVIHKQDWAGGLVGGVGLVHAIKDLADGGCWLPRMSWRLLPPLQPVQREKEHEGHIHQVGGFHEPAQKWYTPIFLSH